MKLKRNIRKTAELGIGLTAIATLVLAGCGGGGGAGGLAASTLGHFMDAAVDGITYSCTLDGQAVSGVTANGGAFNCTQGSTVTFSIGKITLGSASSVGVITPINLAGPGSNSNTPAVQAIVQLLLSLDPAAAASVAASGVPTSISISSAVLAAANNLAPVTIGASSNQAVIDSWLTTIGAATGITYTSIPAASASWHLSGTLNGIFQGTYSGSFAGTYAGTWNVSIDASGNVTGTATDSSGGPVNVVGTVTSTLGAGGNGFNFSGTAGSTPWAGTLDPSTGIFSGTWDGNTANTYTGTKAAAASGSGGAGSGSAAGTGLYTAVTAQDSSSFLSLLNTACTVKTVVSGGTDYSHCTQQAMAPIATNLVYRMWMGGLPHQTGGSIVGGPSSYTPGTAIVSSNQGMAGIAVNDSCTVNIAEPFIPLVRVETSGVRYYAQGINFNFNGTANDSISVTSGGVVSQYTMTNGQGGKIEVHPNLALFGGGQSGTEAVVGSVDNSGIWTNFFICK